MPPKFAILIYMDIDTLLKNTSRSLYLSVQALPAALRPAFGIAYLLCRYADTIADTQLLPAERRIYWINHFPLLIQEQNTKEEKQLVSEICGKTENPHEALLVKNLMSCLAVFNQISEPQKSFILEVVHAVCDGMKIDLTSFPLSSAQQPGAFQTEQDLHRYCRLMGGKPGRFWSQLIYSHAHIPCEEEVFYQLGEQVGDALQIVNILRDLPKDLQQGRCYFPQTDLQQAGLTTADLLDPKNSIRFEPIKQKWIAWGKNNLSVSKRYYGLISKTQPRIRTSVAWPMLWTADTFAKLSAAEDLLNPNKRIKIPRSTIYKTMFLSPFILLSNTLFTRWLERKLNRLA